MSPSSVWGAIGARFEPKLGCWIRDKRRLRISMSFVIQAVARSSRRIEPGVKDITPFLAFKSVYSSERSGSSARNGVSKNARSLNLSGHQAQPDELEMTSFNDLNTFAAARGEGLHPKLLELRFRSIISSHLEVVVRSDGMLQAGPNPTLESRAPFGRSVPAQNDRALAPVHEQAAGK